MPTSLHRHTRISDHLGVSALTVGSVSILCPAGQTFRSITKPIKTLPKKTIRIITFSHPRDHSKPLFHELKILNVDDLISFYIYCCLLINVMRQTVYPNFLIIFSAYQEYISMKQDNQHQIMYT